MLNVLLTPNSFALSLSRASALGEKSNACSRIEGNADCKGNSMFPTPQPASRNTMLSCKFAIFLIKLLISNSYISRILWLDASVEGGRTILTSNKLMISISEELLDKSHQSRLYTSLICILLISSLRTLLKSFFKWYRTFPPPNSNHPHTIPAFPWPTNFGL